MQEWNVQIPSITHHPAHSVSEADVPVSAWRRSSRSMANGDCVEVAGLRAQSIGVRDSKNHREGILRFTAAQWGTFLDGVRDGAFDL